jgi:ferric-dicitrate binding protein FerR (iron transport regulator)
MNIHKHDGSRGKDNESLPDEFSDDLENYRLSENKKISLSESEVEGALENVLQQLEDDVERDTEPDKGYSFNWKLMSIAASITFIGMLFFLSIPITVEVPNAEFATVNLPDGTSITLNSGSELSYSRLYNYMAREVTLSGEGYFDVESDPDKPFTVNTVNSSIKVLGTEFNLSDWDEKAGPKVKLTVTEGSVEIKEKSGRESMILQGNESAIINESSEIISSTFELDKRLAWLSNNIAFQNETLLNAFGILERRFDVTIDLDKGFAADQESITAFYHDPKDPESIIQDICTIKGLSYQKTHNGFKITES